MSSPTPLSVREMIVHAVNTSLLEMQHAYTAITTTVPGSNVIVRYIQKSYQDDPFRVALEVLLLVFAVRYLLARKYQPDAREVLLTRKEEDEIIREWQPESLVPTMSPEDRQELARVPVIDGPSGSHVQLVATGDDSAESAGQETYLNMASFDFLGLCDQKPIHDAAVRALRKYGVGACGPPGFYGTLDVHLQLEETLARFLGTQSAIIYAQAFSTVSGVIPAFSKKGDILIVDDGVCFAVQKGVQISRSTVRYFKHNDMADLERVLVEVQRDEKRLRRPLTRRFIVVEGIYQNSGDIVPLPQLLALKHKFKYRLMVEETLSFGVLGKRGAGVTDHFGIDAKDVDIIMSSLAHSLASGGGFCAGSVEVTDHQRLSGASYCYSAALPAMLAVAAIEGLHTLEKKPALLKTLHDNCNWFRESFGVSRFAHLHGDTASPMLHLRLAANFTPAQANHAIAEVVDIMRREHRVLVTRAKYAEGQEAKAVQPSLRLCLTAAMSRAEVEQAAISLKAAVARVVGVKQ